MAEYNDDNITTLEWDEHIRTRPGMYIGKLGDGSAHDDGIYVLFKEVIDNAIDEFMQGFGKTIEISIKENKVTIRDYGRGIPLTKVVDCVSKMNTGGKFKEGTTFDNSIGMNGVGVKAVNALSTYFFVQSVRDGQKKTAETVAGLIMHAAAVLAYIVGEGLVDASNKAKGNGEPGEWQEDDWDE